jgi:hypothetical protein
VLAEELERGLHVDLVRVGDEALGLLDDDTGVQRTLQLLLRKGGVVDAALLQRRHSG